MKSVDKTNRIYSTKQNKKIIETPEGELGEEDVNESPREFSNAERAATLRSCIHQAAAHRPRTRNRPANESEAIIDDAINGRTDKSTTLMRELWGDDSGPPDAKPSAALLALQRERKQRGVA